MPSLQAYTCNNKKTQSQQTNTRESKETDKAQGKHTKQANMERNQTKWQTNMLEYGRQM